MTFQIEFEVNGNPVAWTYESEDCQDTITNKDPDKGYIQVPVTKASSKGAPAYIEICWDDLPQDMCREIIAQGMKVVLNRGMTDVPAGKTEESKKIAMEIARANAKKIAEGKAKMTAASRSKLSGALKAEAMRVARIMIKDALKDAGEKVSHYKPKAISEAAEALLASENGKAVLAAAKKNLEERAKEEASMKKELAGVITATGLKADPELKRKAEQKNKKVSAAIIGQVKGGQATHAKH